MKAISARIPEALDARLTAVSEQSGIPRSELLRQALEQFLNGADKAEQGASSYDLARDLCGCLKGGPPDLATNRKYMEGFGE